MKKQLRPSNIAFKMAKIVDAIEKGIELKAIRVEGNALFLFREMFPKERKAQELYAKNLYLYAILKKIIKEDEALIVKDIETGIRIAFYKKKICIID